MVLQTKRLLLRQLTQEDFPALCKILQDKEVMYAYEHAFSDEEVQDWLNRQIERYEKYGFGLWAVILKDTGELIGQCGLTTQPWEDREVLEVGYLFQKAYWHQGYATEAAQACKSMPLKPWMRKKYIPSYETTTSPPSGLPSEMECSLLAYLQNTITTWICRTSFTASSAETPIKTAVLSDCCQNIFLY